MKLYKNGNPAISIILPTYNRAKLLTRAVDSVFNQTYKNFELIVVDDGSTDDTYDRLQQYMNAHANLRYVRQQNMKLPIALNTGIRLSSGRYITFINSDDIFRPDHLQLRIDYLTAHPDIDLIHGGVEIIGNPYVRDKDDLSKFIHIDDCAVGATFFGKRKVFTRLQGYRELKYGEDSDFLERAAKIFRVKKTKQFATYLYNRNVQDSITNNMEPNEIPNNKNII